MKSAFHNSVRAELIEARCTTNALRLLDKLAAQGERSKHEHRLTLGGGK